MVVLEVPAIGTGLCVTSGEARGVVVLVAPDDDDSEVFPGFGIMVAVIVLEVSTRRDLVLEGVCAVVVLLPMVGDQCVLGGCEGGPGGADSGGPPLAL